METSIDTTDAVHVRVNDLRVFHGTSETLKGINVTFNKNCVTAIMGPSGCGKSTLLRSVNRMNDFVRDCRMTGTIEIDGTDIHAKGINPIQLRAGIGMVFQKPNPFTMSVYRNVAFGPRMYGLAKSKADMDVIVERALRRAALWDEVKDGLDEPAQKLSGGQQQRLIIARVLAIEPPILLMDEPCSALDPIATAYIEELIDEIKETCTILIVTHNLQQAARVSSQIVFLYMGSLIEAGATEEVMNNPREELTRNYITGRYG